METMTIGGKTYYLWQDAYVSDNGKTYQAHASLNPDDNDDDDYMIYWDVIADEDDQSNNCDWDNPRYIIDINHGRTVVYDSEEEEN